MRNSYHHGEKFVGGPEGQRDRDRAVVIEAHAVLDEAIASCNLVKGWQLGASINSARAVHSPVPFHQIG